MRAGLSLGDAYELELSYGRVVIFFAHAVLGEVFLVFLVILFPRDYWGIIFVLTICDRDGPVVSQFFVIEFSHSIQII